MTRTHVGKVSEFEDGSRRLVPGMPYEIGIFRVGEDFHAYENRCVHQGGPVCEGRFFPRMTAIVNDGGQVLGERYSSGEPHLVCPWHGWEYDLRTGEFCGDRSIRLRRYPVEIEGEDVYVVV